jgi:ribosomal protein L40E
MVPPGSSQRLVTRMARKTVGFTHLEWVCPNCGSRNSGPQKTCSGCGVAQPADVKFEQTEHAELLTDQAEIDRAKAGADIHCAFCGARNPAGTQICANCGADLSQGKQHASGEVVGAFETGPMEQKACPTCGALNPANALRCAKCGAPLTRPTTDMVSKAPVQTAGKTKWWLWGGLAVLGLVVVACVIFFIMASTNTSQLDGTVQSTSWQRSVTIESLGPVTREVWKSDIPADARVSSCSLKYKSMQDQPAPVATEECGTPYSVDQGNGYSEVVQDCQYRVYEDSCSYTVDEWHQTDQAVLHGTDLNPLWPEPTLISQQRLGDRSEEYLVYFSTAKGPYTYKPSDSSQFSQFKPGSIWYLKLNAFNSIISIQPK